MAELQALGGAALWVGLFSIPFVFVVLTFLHAARVPRWVWVMSGRTQIVWLVVLLIGNAALPIGIPAAIYYLLRVRPTLVAIEAGDFSELVVE